MFFAPLLAAMWMSLHDWSLLGRHEFNGLENYARALADSHLLRAALFTISYALVVTPLTLIVAYLLAVLVRGRIPLIGIARTAVFLPVVVGMAAACYLFTLELHPDLGIYSALLQGLGMTNGPVPWLLDPTTSVPTVAVVTTWKTVGFGTIILMAAMQAVPAELHEAAKVDGAGALAYEFRVMLPLIRRSLALVTILTVIGSFLTFDQFYILTKGGPRQSTETLVMTVYDTAFVKYQVGYATAICILILAALLTVTATQLRLSREDAET